MSVLTDLFTSLSNKIRSKLGTTTKYTPAQAIAAIDAVYNKGATDTKKGNAALSDVLATKTFTSSTAGVNQTGTMPNRGAVSPSGLNCGGSYTIPAGYHNGSGKVTANSLASQTRVDSGKSAVTAGAMVSGYQGWVNGSKVTGTFAGQEKTVAPTTRSTTAATPIPDSGRYLTKVTVDTTNVPNNNTQPYTPTGDNRNKSSLDLGGTTHNYRYVNTATCYDYGYEKGAENERSTHAGYINLDGYERGECHSRFDLYGLKSYTGIKFKDMRTDARKNIKLTYKDRDGNITTYSSGYTYNSSWDPPINIQNGPFDLYIDFWSETGAFQEAWYQLYARH